MTTLIVLGALILLVGLAALCGWTVDSRDPDFDLGRIIDGPPNRFAG